jgi:hypothetical protein
VTRRDISRSHCVTYSFLHEHAGMAEKRASDVIIGLVEATTKEMGDKAR